MSNLSIKGENFHIKATVLQTNLLINLYHFLPNSNRTGQQPLHGAGVWRCFVILFSKKFWCLWTFSPNVLQFFNALFYKRVFKVSWLFKTKVLQRGENTLRFLQTQLVVWSFAWLLTLGCGFQDQFVLVLPSQIQILFLHALSSH